MAGTMALNLLWTLLTKNGAKVLSRFIGETMICSAHYYSIERKEIQAPIEVSSNSGEQKEENKGLNAETIRSMFPELPDGLEMKILDVADNNEEHLKHIINFIQNMKNIPTAERIVTDPTNRNILTEFITAFGDKGTGNKVGFNTNELFALTVLGKDITGGDQTTIIRYLNMCNK
jgi:hypothetical protein